jgi:hypothetical protein
LARLSVVCAAPRPRSPTDTQAFDTLLGEISRSVGNLNRELRSRFGAERDADQVAVALLAEFLDALPEQVPPAGRESRTAS